MRTILPGLILALSLACGGSDEPTSTPKEPAARPVVPQLPPSKVRAVGPPKKVDATRLHQELVRASERPRVYNFWATWCPPCLAEMPMLRSFAIAHPEVDVVMINVDSRALHDSRVARVIRDNALKTLQHVYLDADDPNPVLAEAVPNWPEQIPLTLVVDITGREVERFEESLDHGMLLEAVARAR